MKLVHEAYIKFVMCVTTLREDNAQMLKFRLGEILSAQR